METFMEPTDIDRLGWIPPGKREEIKRMMAEWTGPGKGFVFIAVPPTPEREGYTIFQPWVDPEAKEI
jgi:hypothetical protein